MEPSAQDVAAVQANLDGGQPVSQPAPQVQQPAPQPAPTYTPGVATPTPAPQQQPAQPTPQPAPSQQPQDPFSMFGASQPTQPTEQVPTPQPTRTPVEPSQPATQEPQITTPAASTAAPVETQYQTFDQYMEEVTGQMGTPPEMPDMKNVNPDDEESVKTFFDDLVNTAVEKASQQMSRTSAIQATERRLWDEAFTTYPTLKANRNLRDMVHAIRIGEFNKGIAITPTQAAERLLDALKGQYQQGIADNQVQTTIEQVQPTGGGSQPIQTTNDQQSVLTSLQTLS